MRKADNIIRPDAVTRACADSMTGNRAAPSSPSILYFLARVDNGERFGKGDHRTVVLAIEQTRAGTRIATKREVRLVKAHHNKKMQLILDI